MAFRMVQDLGLHQDPRFVASDDTAEDHEVQRHIYWGCYTIDKQVVQLSDLGIECLIRPTESSVYISAGQCLFMKKTPPLIQSKHHGTAQLDFDALFSFLGC